MRVVILAGGYGTRLQEETVVRPKPMVEVGGQPILRHIMKHYHHHAMSDFYIALGYRGDFIKNYFLESYNLSGDVSIDFSTSQVMRQPSPQESWKVNLCDTGLNTNTGGRLLRLRQHLQNETFMLTYGDGVSNVNVSELLRFHRQQGKIATVTAVRPPARFGGLVINSGSVQRFTEKPVAGEGWINGGFLVFEPEVFDYLEKADDCSLEADALERIAADGQLAAFQHEGFWQCMDTLRDKTQLEKMWASSNAPWKTWSDTATSQRLQVVSDDKAAA